MRVLAIMTTGRAGRARPTSSAFITMSTREQAGRVLRERRGAVLSNDTRDRFLAALERPAWSAPASIRRAVRQHTIMREPASDTDVDFHA